eukprot:31125-Pelagococcus_subviridis.AAC.8
MLKPSGGPQFGPFPGNAVFVARRAVFDAHARDALATAVDMATMSFSVCPAPLRRRLPRSLAAVPQPPRALRIRRRA